MGSGGRGWAVVVGDLERGWMWMRMDVEVAQLMTQHVHVFGLGDFCVSLRSHNTLLINLLLPNIPINTTHE